MRSAVAAITLVALAAVGATGCASKGFVKSQTDQINSKVDSLGQSLEQTQERTRQNEAKISEVDQKAGAARNAADQAQAAANAADTKAVTADADAKAAADRADAVDKASKRLMYTVTLSEDQGGFQFNKIELPPAAKARLDELVTQIKADPQGAYFEIEGHTDNVGPKDVNDKIGLERAEAVKRYLYEQHQIPLHRMNVISYGPDKPVAPNRSKEGRAQNRRVVIKVLI